MLKDPVVDSEVSPRANLEESLSSGLLARLKVRDPEAWRRLTTLFGPEVYRWCRLAGLRPDDAADIGQEVFRAVSTKLVESRRDEPGDSFRGWLWTITRNKLRDRWKQNRGRFEAVGGSDFLERLAQLPENSESTIDQGGPETSGTLVRQALEQVRSEFEPATWRAFWEVTVDGRPAADVARELGIKPNAVYIAKSRVLGRLRAELGPLIT